MVAYMEIRDRGSVVAGAVWMFVISLLLFWLPAIGLLVAGIVGGKRAGGVGPGGLPARPGGCGLRHGLRDGRWSSFHRRGFWRRRLHHDRRSCDRSTVARGNRRGHLGLTATRL